MKKREEKKNNDTALVSHALINNAVLKRCTNHTEVQNIHTGRRKGAKTRVEKQMKESQHGI